MRGILRKIFRNRPFALTLRGRVLLYFFILSTILLTCLIPLLISFGLCPMPQKEIGRALDSYIISYELQRFRSDEFRRGKGHSARTETVRNDRADTQG